MLDEQTAFKAIDGNTKCIVLPYQKADVKQQHLDVKYINLLFKIRVVYEAVSGFEIIHTVSIQNQIIFNLIFKVDVIWIFFTIQLQI